MILLSPTFFNVADRNNVFLFTFSLRPFRQKHLKAFFLSPLPPEAAAGFAIPFFIDR